MKQVDVIRDEIDIKIKNFKFEKATDPNYLILDLVSYAALLDALGVDPIESEIERYKGLELFIKTTENGEVEIR